jgi:hypothetical protein
VFISTIRKGRAHNQRKITRREHHLVFANINAVRTEEAIANRKEMARKQNEMMDHLKTIKACTSTDDIAKLVAEASPFSRKTTPLESIKEQWTLQRVIVHAQRNAKLFPAHSKFDKAAYLNLLKQVVLHDWEAEVPFKFKNITEVEEEAAAAAAAAAAVADADATAADMGVGGDRARVESMVLLEMVFMMVLVRSVLALGLLVVVGTKLLPLLPLMSLLPPLPLLQLPLLHLLQPIPKRYQHGLQLRSMWTSSCGQPKEI